MPIKQITTEFGHSVPPEAPHNITFHIPGWETARALRRGEPEVFDKLVSIYPRFRPWGEVRKLTVALRPLLDLPDTHGLILFVHPDTFPSATAYSTSPHRPSDHLIPPSDLLFRIIDIPLTLPLTTEPDGDTAFHDVPIRLYAVAYPTARGPGALGVWQTYGTGVSSRLATGLTPGVEGGRVTVAAWRGTGEDFLGGESGKGVGIPDGPGELPLGEGHVGLRKRIAELVVGEDRNSSKITEDDVWLYPTGMAAIYRLHRALVAVRGSGKVVVLGSVFQNSWHLFLESEGGMKHFGRCDRDSGVIGELEKWLEGEKVAGRGVAYVFVEFPSNPILVSVDLKRLREVADKYSIPVVVDETIGSFCNIDVSHVSDVVLTSITKSVNGYANVMGGSIVLPPTSPFHTPLKSTLTTQFHNEYFHADAVKLLSNSQDYFSRSATLNSNALALATFLHSQTQPDPQTPAVPALVKAVLYPPFTDTRAHYQAMMRQPFSPPQQPPTTTAKSFTPGYGCLLAIDFPTLTVAKTFYNHLSVYHGPHLGAHQTLAFPFNDAIWGTADPQAAEYLKTFGANPEQVRISVGLEPVEELIDTFGAALEVARGALREEVEGKKE